MKDYYENLRQRLVGKTSQFKQVELLSYHLPKTAGTSLYLAFEESYGVKHIRRVYEPKDREPLTNGDPFWVYSFIQVLHGHYRPHPNHALQYPKAKRIIWVRDPIDRCWSLLNHWLRLENGPIYARFKAKHITSEDENPAALFDKLVRDSEFEKVINFYQSFTQNVDDSFFDFIGKQEDFVAELDRLSNLIGKPLKAIEANVNPTRKDLPFEKENYLAIFKDEYDFLSQQFGISYR